MLRGMIGRTGSRSGRHVMRQLVEYQLRRGRADPEIPQRIVNADRVALQLVPQRRRRYVMGAGPAGCTEAAIEDPVGVQLAERLRTHPDPELVAALVARPAQSDIGDNCPWK